MHSFVFVSPDADAIELVSDVQNVGSSYGRLFGFVSEQTSPVNTDVDT